MENLYCIHSKDNYLAGDLVLGDAAAGGGEGDADGSFLLLRSVSNFGSSIKPTPIATPIAVVI